MNDVVYLSMWIRFLLIGFSILSLLALTGCNKEDGNNASVNPNGVRPQVSNELPNTVTDPDFPDTEFVVVDEPSAVPNGPGNSISQQLSPAAAVADNDDFHLYSPNTKRCTELAALAKRSGVAQLVVSFEGLMSKQVGFVRKNLVQKARGAVNFGYASVAYGWTNSEQAGKCLQEWNKVYGSDSRVLLVSHSFGAGIATFKFLEANSSARINHVITLDPRTGGTDARYMTSRKFELFQKPGNVDQFTNFWQKRGLRGYGVTGAQNIEVTGSSHTGLPKTDQVFNFFVAALKANQGQSPAHQQETVNTETDLGFTGVEE